MRHKFYLQSLLIIAACLLCLCGFQHTVQASSDEPFYLSQQLSPDILQEGAQYGFAMTADSKWLLVSAKLTDFDSNEGDDTGVVYMYRRNFTTEQWEYYQTLSPMDFIDASEALSPENPFIGAEFGESLAILNNRIAISARYAAEDKDLSIAGQVFTYKWRGHKYGWVPEAIVEPADGEAGDEFGRSVGLGTNTLVVGARFADTEKAEKAGAVYVYDYKGKRKGWQLQKKLTDPNGRPDDEFGRALAIAPNKHLIIGSREATLEAGYTEQGPGVVFYYKHCKKGFQLQQKLIADDAHDGMYFGQSVAVTRNLLVVGARNANTGVNDTKEQGAVYTYRYNRNKSSWQQEQKIFDTNGTQKAQYGFAVALTHFKQGRIAVGARKAVNATEKKTGSVYIYDYDKIQKEWSEVQQLSDASLAKDDEFGQSIAIDPFFGSWVVVGADQYDPQSIQGAGTAFSFSSID